MGSAALLHQPIVNPLDPVEVAAEPGAAPALDALAGAAEDAHAFLRGAWFGAAANGSPLTTLTARRSDGEPVAAIPLVERKLGGLRLGEVPGSYWPYRSFPVARHATDQELAELLGGPAGRAALGRAWRLGPVYADDPTLARLLDIAAASGWRILRRSLGTCYVVDLARLAAEGPWPSTKTLRKNRWCERRLAELGELEFRSIAGADWNDEVLDTLAAIEAESWVAGKGDTKFVDADGRRLWREVIRDPLIAARLRAALLHVGGVPAAFTFSVEGGGIRHYIANSYSERFAERSPGRILLYRDFQQAAEAGIARIGWGAGDPGYKTEMGARPGPEIVDCLFVRGAIPAFLASLAWSRRG